MSKPELVHLCDMHVQHEDEAIVVGQTPVGRRALRYVVSGTVIGPKLNGNILPGGGGWFLSHELGAGLSDARIVMRADDEQLIYVHYPLIFHQSSDILMGEFADDIENEINTYLRTAMHFETASEKYRWLNYVLAVGTTIKPKPPADVAYSIYAIL